MYQEVFLRLGKGLIFTSLGATEFTLNRSVLPGLQQLSAGTKISYRGKESGMAFQLPLRTPHPTHQNAWIQVSASNSSALVMHTLGHKQVMAQVTASLLPMPNIRNELLAPGLGLVQSWLVQTLREERTSR